MGDFAVGAASAALGAGAAGEPASLPLQDAAPRTARRIAANRRRRHELNAKKVLFMNQFTAFPSVDGRGLLPIHRFR